MTQSATYSSKPVARQCAFAALAGDDGGDAPGLEPLEQPAQFGAQHLLVFQAAEERLDGVHNNALGADRVDGKSEADEQTFEIVFAGLGDLRAVELDVVDGKLFLGDQLLDVVVERTDILDEVFGLLFEGKEGARLVVFDRAVVKEGHAEQGLAAARRAAQQGGPSFGEAALSHLIKATNAGWRLANGGQTACLRARLLRHRNSSPALLSTSCWSQPARNAATSTPSPANRPAAEKFHSCFRNFVATSKSANC
jgi:hypothetical protein